MAYEDCKACWDYPGPAPHDHKRIKLRKLRPGHVLTDFYSYSREVEYLIVTRIKKHSIESGSRVWYVNTDSDKYVTVMFSKPLVRVKAAPGVEFFNSLYGKFDTIETTQPPTYVECGGKLRFDMNGTTEITPWLHDIPEFVWVRNPDTSPE